MSDSARIGVLVSALFIVVFTGPVSAAQETAWKAEQVKYTTPLVETGIASYYSGQGLKASGRTHESGLTAAHRTLPFGSRVQVTDLGSGREIVVVIDDRGPFLKKRIIDLSQKAAVQLGIVKRGIARVRIRQID
jgi:rare lipoprotein A